MPTLTNAPTPKQFAKAFTRGFAADVRRVAGRDGRLSKNEASKMTTQYRDNALNYLERTGQKSVSVNKLIGKAHNYAVAVAAKEAGPNQRLSLVEARNLPDDIRGDFYALRGKEDPLAKLSGAALSSALANADLLSDGSRAMYTSESDSYYNFVEFDGQITENNLIARAETLLKQGDPNDRFDNWLEHMTTDEMAVKTYSGTEARAFLDSSEFYEDFEDYGKENADAEMRIQTLLNENLTNLSAYKVGPKADDGTLAEDQGSYVYLLLGTDAKGNTAGVYFGAAET